MHVIPQFPAGVTHVTELRGAGGLYVHPQWQDAFPRVVQGITPRDADMSLFTGTPVHVALERWRMLRDALHARVIVHARQVHGAHVHAHRNLPDGLLLAPDADGHATQDTHALLAVSVADCVPISIVASASPAIAQLHGGWRGVAAGILERGVAVLVQDFRAQLSELHLHLGPAICGACYEVGSEVVAGLGLHADSAPAHVDIRAALAQRAVALGISAQQISVSTFCTRHGDSPFYSHRGGCSERQISVLALRS